MRTDSTDNNPLKILLIEDNPGDVVIVQAYLKQTGTDFSLTQTSLLSDAVKLIASQDFNVVLLDLGLPDSIGIETLKKIQASEITAPIIVMTGLDDEEMALLSVKEGAQDYLVKNTLSPGNILKAIRYSIERKNIQEIIKKHSKQFAILSSARGAINECEDVLSIYQTFCQHLQSLLSDFVVLPVDFTDQYITTSLFNEQVNRYVEEVRKLNNLTTEKIILYINNILKEAVQQFPDGRLHKLPKNIHETLASKYGLELTPELTERLFADEIYTIGFAKNDQYYGGVVIFSRQIIEAIDMEIIEAISSQASLNIHRKYVENDLKFSEKRYRVLFGEVQNAKEELQLLNENLETKIQIRTNELAETNSLLKKELEERNKVEEKLKKYATELKELNATKDKFFGIIAHDLRNPFSSLLGASELLIDYLEKFDIDNIKSIVMLLNDSAKRGYALLENLLEWSRAQTGGLKFNPERHSLHELVTENINSVQINANKHISITHNIPEDLQIKVDRNMFNAIMRNLLSNAVKFTHRGGKVFVSSESSEECFTITIKDTGIGIPKADIKKLFRIDVSYSSIGTAKESGTGLGLLLCKEFVERHCGKIWVESVVGKGSEFKFTIPKNIPVSKEANAPNILSNVPEK